MKTTWCALLAVLLGACSVTYPQRWSARARPGRVVAPSSGAAYGRAPATWELGERRALLRSMRHEVIRGVGLSRADLEFEVGLVDSSVAIRCSTEPSGPGMPETPFGCWSSESGARLRFWIAPGERCPSRHRAAMQTLTTPACWQGELQLGDERIQLSWGALDQTGAPVGYVTWVSESRRLLLAADIVAERRIEVFDGESEVRRATRDALLLLTLALHHYKHGAWET